MAQPGPPNTRQSGPEAKKANRDELHTMKPGGPIDQPAQGYENPGPTTNLRGVAPNTAMHRGEPNPPQSGSDVRHGDHNPGTNNDVHGHGVASAPPLEGRTAEKSKKAPPPPPNERGVRK